MKPKYRQQLHNMINRTSLKEILEELQLLCEEGEKNNPDMGWQSDANRLKITRAGINN